MVPHNIFCVTFGNRAAGSPLRQTASRQATLRTVTLNSVFREIEKGINTLELLTEVRLLVVSALEKVHSVHLVKRHVVVSRKTQEGAIAPNAKSRGEIHSISGLPMRRLDERLQTCGVLLFGEIDTFTFFGHCVYPCKQQKHKAEVNHSGALVKFAADISPPIPYRHGMAVEFFHTERQTLLSVSLVVWIETL